MSKSVKVDALSRAIAFELEQYQQSVADGVKSSVRQVAAECRDEIRQNSPVRTGKYRRGWQSHTDFESAEAVSYTHLRAHET